MLFPRNIFRRTPADYATLADDMAASRTARAQRRMQDDQAMRDEVALQAAMRAMHCQLTPPAGHKPEGIYLTAAQVAVVLVALERSGVLEPIKVRT